VPASQADLPAGPRLARQDGGRHGEDVSAASRTAPLILLSYSYSGAYVIQQALGVRADLACTAGTGILPLCEAALATWARVDDREGERASQLALSSVRALVSTQINVLTTVTGKSRWCELATSPPSAARAFLQLFSAASFICIHRSCLEVISDAIMSQPWGLARSAMRPFVASYLGNSVAAAAAYWVAMTNQLLAFEASSQDNAVRLRYEDFRSGAGHALAALRPHLYVSELPADLPAMPAERDHWHPTDPLEVPLELVPADLRERIDRLHADLGFAGISWPAPE
jgi:hypothetical protein